jgi:hypothetical protein
MVDKPKGNELEVVDQVKSAIAKWCKSCEEACYDYDNQIFLTPTVGCRHLATPGIQ